MESSPVSMKIWRDTTLSFSQSLPLSLPPPPLPLPLSLSLSLFWKYGEWGRASFLPRFSYSSLLNYVLIQFCSHLIHAATLLRADVLAQLFLKRTININDFSSCSIHSFAQLSWEHMLHTSPCFWRCSSPSDAAELWCEEKVERVGFLPVFISFPRR